MELDTLSLDFEWGSRRADVSRRVPCWEFRVRSPHAIDAGPRIVQRPT